MTLVTDGLQTAYKNSTEAEWRQRTNQQRETTAYAYCSSWNVEETAPANEILVAHEGSVCEQALACIVRFMGPVQTVPTVHFRLPPHFKNCRLNKISSEKALTN